MPPGLPSVKDAYSALNSFNSSRPSASSYMTQANNQYGVDAANKQVTNLQSLVGNLQNAAAAVAPSVAGRTAGTFTTQAQRDALISREQQPILTNLNQENQSLGQAQSAQGQAQGMAQQMANTLYAQDQQKYQSLLDQYNAANAADQFNKQLQAQAQQAQAAQAYQQQQLAEQIREFNVGQANAVKNQPMSIADELSSLRNQGINVGNATAASKPITPAIQSLYNTAQNLVSQVQAGNGIAASQTIAAAKRGDANSKQIMQAFYELQNMAIPRNFRSFLS